MKFLFIAKQERNVAAYLETLGCLVDRGHHVAVAVQERDESRDRRLEMQMASPRFRMVPCPPDRLDEWADAATLTRWLRDCLRYARPPLAGAAVLKARVFERLADRLGPGVDAAALAEGAAALSPAQIARLENVLRLAERGIPVSPLFEELIRSQRPDVLLVTPVVHFGSAQADVVAAGRRLGVPVWMLLFSWDNLSTKGSIHVPPDLIFAWNERQRAEAAELHGFPPSRVVVVGAPRFDEFFRLSPAMTREQFHELLDLDASRPTILYLCSSRLVAPRELEFVCRWLAALRAASCAVVRECNVIIRPHPDIDLLPDGTRFARVRWEPAPSFSARIARPFADPAAVVLESSPRDPRGLYESLVHSTAVVGLNTTAELEAGIVGRPVFTIEPDGGESGHQPTLHFHYLTREHGGFVSVAVSLEEHLDQLAEALVRGVDAVPIRSFIESFLRPHGIDRPVAPLLADALERHAAAASAAPAAIPPERDDAAAGEWPETEPTDAVRLGYRHARILVRVTPEQRLPLVNGAVPLDRGILKWLRQSVSVGDVVYDAYAGWGPYTLVAATQRGAVVVAFEPSHKVFGSLCDNLVLNACHTSVIPVPLALGDREGVAELKFDPYRPGSDRHALERRKWRPRPAQVGAAYLQPVCVTTLDRAIEQYGLPRANHLRVSPQASVEALLAGARATLAHPDFRSLWLEVVLDEETAVADRLIAIGLRLATRKERRRSVQMVFTRAAAVAGAELTPAGEER